MKKGNTVRIICLAVFLCGTIVAQVTTGTISGTVKDSTGAVIPGAKVVLLNEETGLSRTVQTDTGGRYSAPSLNPGSYRVTASQEGFQTEVRSGIALSVGREAVVDLTLPVGAVTQTVEVTGEAPLVESTTANLGSLVDDRTIRELPLNGRSYDQLALLQPGVNLFSPGIVRGSPFQGGTGKRFSASGSRPNTNNFLLDGQSINDQANATPGGSAGTNLGVDTILEFKILTNSYNAEYGHSAGAVITSVTRSGTNSLHGSAFEYIRNSVLDARNFFDGASVPPFRRNQFGGTIGGPIKKDNTFFFGGYEGLRQGLGTTLITTVPTVQAKLGILPTGTVSVNPASVPFLKLYPDPNSVDYGDGTGAFTYAPVVPTNEDNFMVRIDHRLNEKTTLFGRYTFDNDSYNALQGLPDIAVAESSRRQYTTLQANSVLSAKKLNNIRFSYNRSFQFADEGPAISLGPEYSFIPGQTLGLIQIGAVGGTNRTIPVTGDSGLPRSYGYNYFEWADDFSYVTGRHSLKTGVLISRIQDNTNLSTYQRGAYTFPTFTQLLTGTPSNFQGVPVGDSAYRGLRQWMYGVYAQDDFTVNSRLTLNLGLRWEAASDPREVNNLATVLPSISAPQFIASGTYFTISKKNFEPRVGLAWRLNESGKTVLRAGAGIYHNQLLPWGYGNVVKLPPYLANLSLTNPPFPNAYQVLQATGVPSVNNMNPSVNTPVNDQYNVSIQQQLFRDTVIQVAYVGSKSSHIVGGYEADTPIPTILPGGQVFYPVGSIQRNPNFANDNLWNTVVNARYNGVTFTLRRQSATGLQYQITYTYSKNMDQQSGLANAETARSPKVMMDPENLALDRGLSDWDCRNNFVFNFSYPLPLQPSSGAVKAVLGGWTINGIGTFNSGLPFTAVLATNTSRNHDTNAAIRPNLNPGASNSPVLGHVNHWYDASVFTAPPPGEYGNLGRNTIIGPGIADLDLSLEKSFSIREPARMTFRAEFFNIINHANFGLPNSTALTATGAPSATAGLITSTTTSSRQIQFALRITF